MSTEPKHSVLRRTQVCPRYDACLSACAVLLYGAVTHITAASGGIEC